jgi:formate dehydrogenase iron-sulfur subunit
VLSLNSLFVRPGLYEVEFGTPLRDVVEDLGQGLKTGMPKGMIIGGPLAGIVPPHLFDTPLGFEELHVVGASVGHGGVVAFDEHTSMAELMLHVFSFGAYESCGKCTPCRVGGRRVEEMLIDRKKRHVRLVRADVTEIVDALAATSLCGLGTGLAEFASSALRYYGSELAPCFA